MPTIEITKRPYQFSFTLNPVWFEFTIDDYTAAGAYVQARLYTRDIGGVSGDETLLLEQTIKPASNVISWYIEDLLHAALSYQAPDPAGANIQSGFPHIKEFFVTYRRITDADPSAAWLYDPAPVCYAIKGGIANPLWDYNNYFINYCVNELPFLTWQPNRRFVGLKDKFFISFLNTANEFGNLNLKITVEFSDGNAMDTFEPLPDDGSKLLYHIGVGIDQLGLQALDPSNQVYKYTIHVMNLTNGAILAGPYIFYVDYRNFYDANIFHLYNSLGGLDCIRIRGDIDFEVSRNYNENERYNPAVIIGAPESEQYLQHNVNKVDIFKGEAGYVHTIAEQDAFQELLLSRFIWERINEINTRIYITNKSTKLRSKSDKKWTMAFEWRYAFTNYVYTPQLAALGVGQYIPPAGGGGGGGTCAVPSGLAVITNVTGSGDTEVTFSWIQGVAGRKCKIEVQEDGSGVWTIIGLSAGTSLMWPFTTSPTLMHWRLATVCATDVYSAYVDGPDFTLN